MYVLYCVYVPQVAVSGRILLYAVLLDSVVDSCGLPAAFCINGEGEMRGKG
jgi:hypothetical protein